MHYRYFIEENPEKFLKKNKKDTVTTKSMKKLKKMKRNNQHALSKTRKL